jgi:hypothetical protein
VGVLAAARPRPAGDLHPDETDSKLYGRVHGGPGGGSPLPVSDEPAQAGGLLYTRTYQTHQTHQHVSCTSDGNGSLGKLGIRSIQLTKQELRVNKLHVYSHKCYVFTTQVNNK